MSLDSEDGFTRLASGLLAGAVIAILGAAGAVWWYRQAAVGWSAPSPRLWRTLMLIGLALAAVALVLSIVAVARRSGAAGRAGGTAWAITAGVVLVATPIVVGRMAPDGRHAVVIAMDADTGAVRWRVETGGWSLRSLAITGDVVTVLTVGGDSEPCEPVLRRLTLGLAEGTRLSLERRAASTAETTATATAPTAPTSTAPTAPTSIVQAAPTDYAVSRGYVVHSDGEAERWRVDLASLGVSTVKDMVAGSGVVVVTSNGELPLECRV